LRIAPQRPVTDPVTKELFDSRNERNHDRREWVLTGEESVLDHYHNINSVCAQKVRIALGEKGLDAKEHLLTLPQDQHDPAYRKLNPNGVVPTLVHDGKAIVESALILYYLDEAFPEPPLMPKQALLRHRVRLYNKFIDEYHGIPAEFSENAA
jgi:glutathione S-transferase